MEEFYLIDICFLGTGGTLPMADRALSSIYIRLNGHGLLVDCGEGTQVGIRKIGWGFRSIDGMLLTHYHGDHCTGIPGFLLSLDKSGRTAPFDIYGPAGLRRILDGLMVVVPQLSFPLRVHEISPFDEFEAIGMTITSLPLEHGIPCLGYRFFLPRSAKFDKSKAEELNVPLQYWKILQKGTSVTLDDGRTISPHQVTGAPRKGISFVYATDTRPVNILAIAGNDSDLMILEGMYGNDDKLEQALKNKHMIFHEAADLAEKANTGALVLTHFSTSITDPEEYISEATSIFENTKCAQDLMCLKLEFEE